MKKKKKKLKRKFTECRIVAVFGKIFRADEGGKVSTQPTLRQVPFQRNAAVQVANHSLFMLDLPFPGSQLLSPPPEAMDII